jgi:hypothetical protein
MSVLLLDTTSRVSWTNLFSTVIFTLDCIVFIKMINVSFAGGLSHISSQNLKTGLCVLIPILSVEQFIASVLIAPKNSRGESTTAMLGIKMYLGGICVQELLVTYVFVLAMVLHKRQTKREAQSPALPPNWHSTSYALLLSLGCIWSRIAYRLVELSGLFTGYLTMLVHNEVFFYAFECLPVLAALAIWTVLDVRDLPGQCPVDTTSSSAYVYHEVGADSEDTGPINLSRCS